MFTVNSVKIRSMYLQCYTVQEIADVVGLTRQAIDQEIELMQEMEVTSKIAKTANFQGDFQISVYNRFSYRKATNSTDHFGTGQRAMVASRLANMQQGARTDIVEISTMSQTQGAELLNVSRESVVSAKKILDQGSEALIRVCREIQIFPYELKILMTCTRRFVKLFVNYA